MPSKKKPLKKVYVIFQDGVMVGAFGSKSDAKEEAVKDDGDVIVTYVLQDGGK